MQLVTAMNILLELVRLLPSRKPFRRDEKPFSSRYPFRQQQILRAGAERRDARRPLVALHKSWIRLQLDVFDKADCLEKAHGYVLEIDLIPLIPRRSTSRHAMVVIVPVLSEHREPQIGVVLC